jgi:hypothetical protein
VEHCAEPGRRQALRRVRPLGSNPSNGPVSSPASSRLPRSSA